MLRFEINNFVWGSLKTNPLKSISLLDCNINYSQTKDGKINI
jgi:hypothetical protein